LNSVGTRNEGANSGTAQQEAPTAAILAQSTVTDTQTNHYMTISK